ncbi:MAG TPA: DUF4126 domain-containing protein [Candidatus Eisenbacteria bacterium]|jgi:hypothetical protein|nr:DUF4126 domain-containing protein [Candidatus Eisenbacteria bacterium]
MDAVMQQAVVLLAGWSSGISVYLTVALLGLSGRFGWIDLPSGMDPLTHPLIIALAILVFAVEFVADKIPFIDSAWDSVHTFIRPLGAAGLGAMAGTQYGPLAQTGYALLSGTIALDMHAVKASSRLAINTSPEPFSNIAASVAEHSLVIGVFWLFIKHPYLAVGVILLILVATYFFLRMVWGFVRQLFRRDKKPAVS